ncbi:MAG: hypothetical protein JO345_02285 [Streptosporangiaceae bacterium]|nr:hypothetical protein [Streptosporangiaceae bacterium]
MGCKGLHCDGCNHGSGGPAAAVIALLVIVAVAAREVWPKVVHAVEIAAWTVAGITGAAILITAMVLTVRVVRRVRARRAARVTYHVTPVIPAVRLTDPSAIDRPEWPERPALGQSPRRQPGAWPLPGWWEDIRPRIGGDSDERRPR